MFSAEHWSVFSEQTVLEPLGVPPPPFKASFFVAIARAEKTVPAVHGHVKGQMLPSLWRYLLNTYLILNFSFTPLVSSKCITN